MKKVIPILFLLIFFCGCASDIPEETTANSEPFLATEIGSSSYYCITGESEQSDSEAIVKAFSHRIYNPDGEYVVTLTSTIVGKFSSDTGVASISSISGQLSEAVAEDISISEHMSEDTATVIVYLADISVCYFQYRIYPDGVIQFL